jgi:serine/threonine-protein kinase HipA
VDRDLLVHLELAGAPIPVGRLWARGRGGAQSASFEYDRAWLARRDAFSLDPELPLTLGQFHTERPLFNAFADSAPDRWGQTLLRRYERSRATAQARHPRTLLPVDFLTLVDDEARLGALRFKDSESGPFLSTTEGRRVPPLIELPRLLSATLRVLDDKESDADLLLVLAPGTSLGGARPKACVCDKDGQLLVAKFPRKDDDWPVTRWEGVALALAEAASVSVPEWRLETVLRRPVVMVRRFDRRRASRVPFMSGVTAVGASDGDARSYLDLVEVIRREGSDVDRDLRELWRRVAFNVLISNTDDHLRNHGFLRGQRGWRLAPAYDLNPVPTDVSPRVHALALGEADGAASLEAALLLAPAFGIQGREARAIASEVAAAVRRWRQVAARAGLKGREIERMESAFEHEDLEAALRLRRR